MKLYLFGFGNFRIHLAMAGSLAASLALVVVLIVALDWPFRGEISVSPVAYLDVEHGWTTGTGDKDTSAAR